MVLQGMMGPADSSRIRHVLRRGLVSEIIERRDAVGLGPDADRARAGDAAVVEFDMDLTIEQNADSRAFEFHAQRVPHVFSHSRFGVLEDAPFALPDGVERDAVLECVWRERHSSCRRPSNATPGRPPDRRIRPAG